MLLSFPYLLRAEAFCGLTSSGTALRFEPLAYYDGSNLTDPDHDAASFANAEVETLLEKFKFDYRVRDALYDGAMVGDYCAHFWFDPEIYARLEKKTQRLADTAQTVWGDRADVVRIGSLMSIHPKGDDAQSIFALDDRTRTVRCQRGVRLEVEDLLFPEVSESGHHRSDDNHDGDAKQDPQNRNAGDH